MMTEQEFDSIPDEDLWSAVHKSIYPETFDYTIESVLQLSQPQLAVGLIAWLDSEIGNGGFDQYYFNTNGEYDLGENEQLLPTVLELVGAVGCADVSRRANRVLNENKGKVRDSFSKVNYEVCDFSWATHLFDSFDDEWCECIERENLEELMIRFIRKHKSDFCEVQK